jgi:hypothetical protein
MAPNDLAVQVIANTALPACTYNNGTGGVGATLTASANNSFPAFDGWTIGLNDYIAINGQATATQNGLYTLTTQGSGSNPWILTRRSPDDANIWTNPFCVLHGNKYTNTVWCSPTIASNIGTDAISFIQQVVALNTLADCANTNEGEGCIYIGSGAGNQNGSVNNNIGIGPNTLSNVINSGPGVGNNNTAIGSPSMTATTTGTQNAAVGTNTLANNTTGSFNTALGMNSQYNLTTGNYNVGIGYDTLFSLTTGSNNIAIGKSNGSAVLVSGSGNILIGNDVDVSSASTSNYLNIGGAITGDMTTGPALMNGFTGTTQSSGDSSTKVATTAFVQNVVGAITAGLDSRPSCRVATTAALTATYSNGSSGVGATLTNSGTKSAITIDGVALSANDRVLVKDQATAAQNGIYTVTTVGSGSVNWVLTRATDFNSASGTGVVEGAFTVIEEGTSNTGTFWIETGAGPFTIGTTAITFTQLQLTNDTGVQTVSQQVFTANGTYTPSAGMVYCIVECIGGGGGSGGVGAVGATCNGAGGGGGGGYSRGRLTAAQVGASKTVTTGAGGTAGSSSSGNGGAGGDTSVGTLVIAKGGAGGTGAGTNGGPVAGGAGGVAGTGDVTIPGSPGKTGYSFSDINGNNRAVGGAGGAAPLGPEPDFNFTSTHAAGIAGPNYGSGASGAAAFNVSGSIGGAAGAKGIVIITEFCTS